MNPAQDYKSLTKDAYNLNAADFASHATIFRGRLENWIKTFSAQLIPGSLILDVGCGTGRDAKYFSDGGFKVLGIDISEKLIEIAKNSVADAQFTVMDFEDLQFPKDKFDGIWANASLYHLPKNKFPIVLSKLWELLKRDGLLFVNMRVGIGEKITEEKRGDGVLKRFGAYYQPDELLGLFQKAGFIDVHYELDTIDSGDWIGVFARK